MLHFVPEYTGYYHFTLMIRLGLPTGVLFSHSINNAYISPFEKIVSI